MTLKNKGKTKVPPSGLLAGLVLVTNVVPLRFERGLSEPKSLVLPLHHGTVYLRIWCAKVRRGE